jgi:hypothetical protein
LDAIKGSVAVGADRGIAGLPAVGRIAGRNLVGMAGPSDV